MPRHVNDSRRSFYGPGALSSFIVSSLFAVVGLGLPILWHFRRVLREAQRDEQVPADIIVVLGRHLDGDRPSPLFVARLDHGARLWLQGLAPRVAVTGGLTGSATRTEAEVGKAHLVASGLPADAIVCEDRSRHTLENLSHLRDLMAANGWGRVLMVSDAFHLVRAAALARGFGMDVVCSPAPGGVPTSRASAWGRALQQAFMLHWYHTGVAYSRLIGSRRMLERVT